MTLFTHLVWTNCTIIAKFIINANIIFGLTIINLTIINADIILK